MRTLSIAWKDIQIFLKDRGAVVMSFLLPLIFIVVFSYVFSGMGAEDEVVTLPVVNQLIRNGKNLPAIDVGMIRDHLVIDDLAGLAAHADLELSHAPMPELILAGQENA